MGSSLNGGEIILLNGELGAGKTTFVQGLAKGLGIDASITSPTFILMRTYTIPKYMDKVATHLYHVDLYRLEDNVDEEIENLGVFDLWSKGNSIFVVEWANKLEQTPKKSTSVSIEVLENDKRLFHILNK